MDETQRAQHAAGRNVAASTEYGAQSTHALNLLSWKVDTSTATRVTPPCFHTAQHVLSVFAWQPSTTGHSKLTGP